MMEGPTPFLDDEGLLNQEPIRKPEAGARAQQAAAGRQRFALEVGRWAGFSQSAARIAQLWESKTAAEPVPEKQGVPQTRTRLLAGDCKTIGAVRAYIEMANALVAIPRPPASAGAMTPDRLPFRQFHGRLSLHATS